jgi:hypothetical protein
VATLDPKPAFCTNVAGVLIVKMRCDDHGVLAVGDLAVSNEWPNQEYAKAWKVIEANTTNVVDITWDSRDGGKWNFDYECYFYPQKPIVKLLTDVPEGVAVGGKRQKATFSFDCDVETNGIVSVSCVNGVDKISLWTDITNGVRISFANSWSVSNTNSFSFFIQGETLSSYQEVEFECTYAPVSGEPKSVRDKMTVFSCYTQPIENISRLGYQVVNPSFLSPYTNAVFRVDVNPIDIPNAKICWQTVSGTALFQSGTNGTQSIVQGVNGMVDIEVSVLGVSEENMHFKSKVIQ